MSRSTPYCVKKQSYIRRFMSFSSRRERHVRLRRAVQGKKAVHHLFAALVVVRGELRQGGGGCAVAGQQRARRRGAQKAVASWSVWPPSYGCVITTSGRVSSRISISRRVTGTRLSDTSLSITSIRRQTSAASSPATAQRALHLAVALGGVLVPAAELLPPPLAPQPAARRPSRAGSPATPASRGNMPPTPMVSSSGCAATTSTRGGSTCPAGWVKLRMSVWKRGSTARGRRDRVLKGDRVVRRRASVWSVSTCADAIWRRAGLPLQDSVRPAASVPLQLLCARFRLIPKLWTMILRGMAIRCGCGTEQRRV